MAPAPSAEPVPTETSLDRAISEARREAERVVEDAHRRIAEIGAGVQALLARSLAARGGEAPTPASRRRESEDDETPERRVYQGVVELEAGPFDDVLQLSEFEGALLAIPGVDDVYIRTFARHHARFELRVTQPTRLIADLQARAADALCVVEAAESRVRLDIFKDE